VPRPIRWLDLEAPAKINLGLRVTGTRPDGYHLIESLFLPLDLVDGVRVGVGAAAGPADEGGRERVEIEVAPAEGAEEVPGAAAVPADRHNLAFAAAEAYLAALPEDDVRPEVRISLRKRIPAAAGLGGGSSDAAAVLRGLAALIPKGPQGADLARVALGLGADVPYFLAPAPAVVRGIGEQIERVSAVPALTLLLVNPGDSVATAEVYAAYDALARDPDEAGAALTPPGAGSTMPALSGPGAVSLDRLLACPNDLEPAAIRLCPSIARVRDRVRALGAIGVGMSGSGATVYGVFASEDLARAARQQASFEPPIWARVVRSRSPSRG